MAKIESDSGTVSKVHVLRQEKWKIERHGQLDEVEMANGSLRFRVTVWDAGREPFIVQWFNDPVPAADFLERLLESAVE